MGKQERADNSPPSGGAKRRIPQAAAIPFIEKPTGALRVLLVRRHRKRKWGIPKGVIEPGQTAKQTAHIEALEEAGIAGVLSSKSVGEFEYDKWGGVCRVAVYLMRVTQEVDDYPESEIRERRWFDLAEALRRPTRQGIGSLLKRLPDLVRQSGI